MLSKFELGFEHVYRGVFVSIDLLFFQQQNKYK